MKKLLLSFIAFVLVINVANAQTQDQKFSAGIHAGVVNYNGELSRVWLKTDKAYRAQFGISAAYNLNSYFNLAFDASKGSIGYHVPEMGGFRADLTQGNLQLRFKINNGRMLKEDCRFQPYVFGGFGFAMFKAKDDDSSKLVVEGTDFTKNIGLGFTVKVTDNIGLNFNTLYTTLSSDRRDKQSLAFNDQYLINSIGVIYNFGKPKDTDADGVTDANDKCPETPAGVQVDKNGCPLDTDKDGVADYQDECPEVAGTKETKGCPDADKDGVADKDDQCPEEAGPTETGGCPDKDGDGVADKDDKCPNVKGTKAMKGCPDADGDGVPEFEDDCPEVAGSKSNKGCPEPDPVPVQVISENLEKLGRIDAQFQSGESALTKKYRDHLNLIATELLADPAVKVTLSGYADSKGDKAFNTPLSQKRAEAVKTYFVKKGIDKERITVLFFGEENPKGPNNTPQGLAINRRVEFKFTK
jgi:outer membrane protein OmpA-like peptidoglycan-associated protein